MASSVTASGLLAAGLIYLAYTANVDDPIQLGQGLLMFALAFVPALQWARSGGSRFPVFEPILLLCAVPMPLRGTPAQCAGATRRLRAGGDRARGLDCHSVRSQRHPDLPGHPRRPLRARCVLWRESILSERAEGLIVYGLILSTLYVYVSIFTTLIPADLESLLRAVFFGLSILCTFVSTQRWGRGEMSSAGKLVLTLSLLAQVIFTSTTLILITAPESDRDRPARLRVRGKRVPWVVIAVVFVSMAVLHTGKTRMREKYCGPKPKRFHSPPSGGLPAFYSEWIPATASPFPRTTGKRPSATS